MLVQQCSSFFFFFQAEDGIRDLTVTGVQTCALPIFGALSAGARPGRPLSVSGAAAPRQPSNRRGGTDHAAPSRRIDMLRGVFAGWLLRHLPRRAPWCESSAAQSRHRPARRTSRPPRSAEEPPQRGILRTVGSSSARMEELLYRAHHAAALSAAGRDRRRGARLSQRRRPVCGRGTSRDAGRRSQPAELCGAFATHRALCGAAALTVQILYEEEGDLKVGAVLARAPASFQVESPHGRRSKVKAANVLLAFERPPAAELLMEAKKFCADLDVEFLWQCSGSREFGFQELAREYVGRDPTPVQAAGVLMKLQSTPMYFYRRGKGRFQAAPEETLKLALAGLAKKKRGQETIAAGPEALARYSCPPEIAALREELLYAPDRAKAETKALEQARRGTEIGRARVRTPGTVHGGMPYSDCQCTEVRCTLPVNE